MGTLGGTTIITEIKAVTPFFWAGKKGNLRFALSRVSHSKRDNLWTHPSSIGDITKHATFITTEILTSESQVRSKHRSTKAGEFLGTRRLRAKVL